MVSIFKKVDFPSTLIAGAIAAMLFGLPVIYYIKAADYQETWWLFVGSFLFMIVMWVHVIRDSRKRDNNESTVAFVFSSHIAALTGVIFSCLVCLLLFLLMPGHQPDNADSLLKDSPANMIKDKTNGLRFNVFMVATFVNFSVGSFTGIILPFYLKRNQTRDSRAPLPLHQRGKK